MTTTKLQAAQQQRIKELRNKLEEVQKELATHADELDAEYIKMQADFIKFLIANLRGKNPRRALKEEEFDNAQKVINNYGIIAARPVYYGQKGRELVKYWRACSAWYLAQRINGEYITVEEYERAQKLLQSIINYALADAREWERANTYESYFNSRTMQENQKRLYARREKLQKSLARYGLYLDNYGLYPTICDADKKQPSREVSLYYFD